MISVIAIEVHDTATINAADLFV